MNKNINNERNKRRYKDLLEKNLCPSCGFRKPAENSNFCTFCLKLARDRYHKRKLDRLAECKCVNCGNDLINTDKIHCDVCLEKRKQYSKEYYKKNREEILEKMKNKRG